MNWYYSKGDQRQGPVSTEKLRSLMDLGELDPNTLVWNETLDGWKRLPDVDLGDGLQAAAQCSECGRSFSVNEMVAFEGRQICAECKPRFVQRVREGALTPSTMQYGGFWIRFLARLADGLLLTVVNSLITLPFTGLLALEPTDEASAAFIGGFCLLMLLQLGVSIGYEVGFVGSKGATPGKMLLGLKIVMADGGKVSYARALGRQLSTFVSSIVLMIGYIMAAFDDEKRALHDHMCNTRVIRT
jgi:uncharacterized RDD family membrane protein YckC